MLSRLVKGSEPKLKAVILGVFCFFPLLDGSEVGKVSAEESSTDIRRGSELARKHCARCHAIGRAGVSPDLKAPPFRVLGRRYPLASLEEAFAEGVVVGHSRMPNFEFDSDEVGALIAYLRSIQ